MKMRLSTLACLLVAACGTARAHDTWFERLPAATAPAPLQLALGTGTLYPLYESGIDARYLARQGCRGAQGGSSLRALRNEAATLVVQARADAATCWAQLTPFEIELAPDKIELYLHEIQAGPALRAAWADIHARGLPWKERYTKHARIELAGDGAMPVPVPVPMSMDALLEDGPARVGQPLHLRVLRDGRPLADFPVELRSELSRQGLWRRTDAEGRVQVTLPLAGAWILRGVDLRLSASRPDEWDSRFLTLAFTVQPRTAQNSLTSNALSTNQAAATAAMSSEPPVSTARR
jgi:hypothetical protein